VILRLQERLGSNYGSVRKRNVLCRGRVEISWLRRMSEVNPALVHNP